MPVLPIVTGDREPILRTKTKEIPKLTKDIKTLIDDMLETVAYAKGAGLAAPQVGRSERLCVALIGGIMTPLLNPSISWRSEETDVLEEGCLSLPNVWLDIQRPTSIIVKFQSHDFRGRELKLSGFDARVVQHEVDHLDGILILDRAKKK